MAREQMIFSPEKHCVTMHSNERENEKKIIITNLQSAYGNWQSPIEMGVHKISQMTQER